MCLVHRGDYRFIFLFLFFLPSRYKGRTRCSTEADQQLSQIWQELLWSSLLMFWNKDGRTDQEAKAKASFHYWEHTEQIPQQQQMSEVSGIRRGRGESGPGPDGGLSLCLPVLLLLLPLWRPAPGWFQPQRRAQVQLDRSEARRPPQARRPSQRGGGGKPRTGAEENQTPPHHFHRGAAGRSGGALPAESVSRCQHKGETSAADALERGKSGGDDELFYFYIRFLDEMPIFCISNINFIMLQCWSSSLFTCACSPLTCACWLFTCACSPFTCTCSLFTCTCSLSTCACSRPGPETANSVVLLAGLVQKPQSKVAAPEKIVCNGN